MSLSVNQIISAKCSKLAASENLSLYIQMAEGLTSSSYFGTNRPLAVALRAAHMFTLDCRLNGEAGAIQSETEGRLSVSYSTPNSSDLSDLDQTSYGVQLKALMRSAGSMRVIGG